MEERNDARQTQSRLWNGPAGRAWVEAQAVLDGMMAGCEALLTEAVAAEGATRVLDVGCGTGAVSLAIARRLGAGATVTGVDISAPMVALARERAAREGSAARFVIADAQDHAFEPGTFDAIVSRFGVMFFGDARAAFANLRRAARPRALLQALAWRSPADNPFMTAAERAAAPLLPMPPRVPDGPGQFAFADHAKVEGILRDAGWTSIEILPRDVPCAFPASALDLYLSRLGPVGVALQEADERTRETVQRAVRAAFEPWVQGDEVRFTAACWLIGARAP